MMQAAVSIEACTEESTTQKMALKPQEYGLLIAKLRKAATGSKRSMFHLAIW